MDVYERLKELNLALPELPPAGGVYKPVRQMGNCLYVSGQGPTKAGVPVITGKAGVGARSAIGVNELPGNITVEIEFIFEV